MVKPSSVWVWSIYNTKTRSVLNNLERSWWAYRSERGARIAVNMTARKMSFGEMNWERVNPTTWIGRTDQGYLAIVTNVLLPLAKRR